MFNLSDCYDSFGFPNKKITKVLLKIVASRGRFIRVGSGSLAGSI